jgi:hypothetical protein
MAQSVESLAGVSPLPVTHVRTTELGFFAPKSIYAIYDKPFSNLELVYNASTEHFEKLPVD